MGPLRVGALNGSPTVVLGIKDGAPASMAALARLEFARVLFDPAFDHHFFIGVELDGVASLGVHVAKEAAFPSGEREVSHGRGYTDVDADVSGRSFVAKTARGGSARGEERRLIAVGTALQECDGFAHVSRV